jgi:hypothetical protein
MVLKTASVLAGSTLTSSGLAQSTISDHENANPYSEGAADYGIRIAAATHDGM